MSTSLFIKIMALCTLFLAETVSLHSQFRKYSNEFLNIGAGARGLAMGGAQLSSVQDGSAGYWNPAGLAAVQDRPQVNLMHAEYFAGIGKYDFLSVALPTSSGNRTMGISAIRFGVDDIMNTLFLVEPDGSINYNNIQSFSSADYAFLFSYGQRVSGSEEEDHQLQVGFNAKLIHRSVGRFAKAWGFGVDAGIQYRIRQWHFGAVARDVTSTFNAWSFRFTDREKEMLYLTNNDIPVRSTELTAPRLLLGAGHRFTIGNKNSLLAELNMDCSFDGKRNALVGGKFVSIDPKLGVEFALNNSIFFRGGIANFQRALADGDTLNQKKVWIYQPSAGVGIKLGSLMIDYAFINLANQSNPLFTHVFSLKFDWQRKENN
jgi:hypothetical protein